jgi:hypothetical protein
MAEYPLDHRLGYFVGPRDLVNLGPLMRDPVCCQVYLALVCRARHKRGLGGDQTRAVQLENGQCLVGARDLATLTGRDKDTAHRALKRLESLGLITREPGTRGTVVTLVNYGRFGRLDAIGGDTHGDTGGDTHGDTGGDVTNRETDKPVNGRTSVAAAPPTSDPAEPVREKSKREADPQAFALARLLASRIAERDPKALPDPERSIERWEPDIEKLHRLDGREWSEIREVLEWSQQDSFWQPNILSGKKLRAKFNTLRGQMQRHTSAKRNGYSRVSPAADFGTGGNQLGERNTKGTR